MLMGLFQDKGIVRNLFPFMVFYIIHTSCEKYTWTLTLGEKKKMKRKENELKPLVKSFLFLMQVLPNYCSITLSIFYITKMLICLTVIKFSQWQSEDYMC